MGCSLLYASVLFFSSVPAEDAEAVWASPLRIIWDLHINETNVHAVDWLARQGWCWAIEVPPNAKAEWVLPLREQGFTVIGQIHAHPDTRQWHWSRRNATTPDIGAFIELLRRANREAPRVQFFMEDDSAGVGFSAEFLRDRPRSHAQARAMFDRYLQTAMTEAKQFPDVAPWAIAGFAGTAHHYARHGAEFIIVERANDDVEDLQTAIAFARGAARQFGCGWGIDLSLWWGVIYGCVQDLPASFYTRHLWLSYLSGAQAFRIEGGDLLVRPDGPTSVARAIDEFARKAIQLDPGKADVPVAIMLPEDHGWMTPAYWRTTNEAWNYARLPYRQGDRGIDGFFGLAFPGAIYAQDPYPAGMYAHDDPPASPFALSCITPEFAPTPEQGYQAEPPIPFGAFASRKTARETFLGKGTDPSPYRPMGDSRWGDIFDVLTADAPLEALHSYKAVVLLGQMLLTDTLKQSLVAYVRQGGTLLVSAGVASPADSELCGFSFLPELRVGRGWRWEAEAPVHEPFRYCPVDGDSLPSGTRTLATALNGDPIILSHSLGAGTVHTSLIPWFEGGNVPFSGVAARLADHVFRPVQPVLVEGPPAAWVSTSETGATPHRTVVIANHADCDWQGRFAVAEVPEHFTQCTELTEGKRIDFVMENNRAVTMLNLPPFSVRVLRWQPPATTLQ